MGYLYFSTSDLSGQTGGCGEYGCGRCQIFIDGTCHNSASCAGDWCATCRECDSSGICAPVPNGRSCATDGCINTCGTTIHRSCDVEDGSCTTESRCECVNGSCRNYCTPDCNNSCGSGCQVECSECTNIANCNVCGGGGDPPFPDPPPGECWCGDCATFTCALRLISVCESSYGGCGCTNCDDPPPPDSCDGITYLPEGDCFVPNSTMNVNIGRSGATNCNGNWDNIGLLLDGNPVGISLCFQDGTNCDAGYHSQINVGTTGIHTLQFTVNSDSCLCNSTTFRTGPSLPANLTVSCLAPGTSADFSWSAASGADQYPLRMNDTGDGWAGCPGDGGFLNDYCTNVIGTNYTWSGTTPGHNYTWWLHSWNEATGCWSNFVPGPNFSCVGPSCGIVAGDIILTGVGNIGIASVSVPIPPSGGIIQNILFTADNVYGRTIDDNPLYPNPDDGELWLVQIEALAIGNGFYTAVATMDDGVTKCESTANITVNPPDAWLQIEGGDVVVGHASRDPIALIDISIPVLDPITYLMVGTPPGVPIAGGTITTAPGGISSTDWSVANSPYGGDLPSYDTFRRKIPQTIPYVLSGLADESTLLNMGTEYPAGSGYYYFSNAGNFDLLEDSTDPTNTIDIGNERIVVFVDGNVNIRSNIRLTRGVGFFMLIASGNITIDHSVADPSPGAPDNEPEIEGVYFTDGNFSTGTNGSGLDNQLHIRGVVVAAGQVVPQRSNAYADIPGELFEYAPDQSMLIPPALSGRSMTWKEVLP